MPVTDSKTKHASRGSIVINLHCQSPRKIDAGRTQALNSTVSRLEFSIFSAPSGAECFAGARVIGGGGAADTGWATGASPLPAVLLHPLGGLVVEFGGVADAEFFANAEAVAVDGGVAEADFLGDGDVLARRDQP